MVTAVVSHYKRPWNLDKLIPILQSYKLITEIIISHGHKDSVNRIEGEKVINIDDSEDNSKFYTLRRFKVPNLATNEIILLNDDDVAPSESYFTKMVDIHLKADSIYCGPFKRTCDSRGYTVTSKVREANIILPNVSVSSKEVYTNVFKKMQTPKYSQLFNKVIEQKGNCEDIFFNKVYIETYNKKPVVVGPWEKFEEFKWLDCENGFMHKPKHIEQRDEFCKKCFDYCCEMDGPNSIVRWFNV